MSLVRRVSERIRKSFRRRQRPVITKTGDTVDARPVQKGCIRCKIALLDGTDLTIDVEVCHGLCTYLALPPVSNICIPLSRTFARKENCLISLWE